EEAAGPASAATAGEGSVAAVHREYVAVLEPFFVAAGDAGAYNGVLPRASSASGLLAAAAEEPLAAAALHFALSRRHVMPPTRERLVESLFSLLERGAALIAEYNDGHPDFPMAPDHLRRFAERWLLQALLWGLGGSMAAADRTALAEVLAAAAPGAVPAGGDGLADVRVRTSDGEWEPWSASVPRTEIESHRVVSSDVVVTTTDTVRNVEVLRAWLASHRPLILCGPPGSGKTMTLTSTLQGMPELVLAALNFSSSTTPALLHKTFKQYCEYVRTSSGLFLQPAHSLGTDKWLVVFCDEINLPAPDAYGTQHVIAFLRQLCEHQGGFWREDRTWVSLRRIQFVGACNPPEDAGRVPLPPRFLRHAPLLLVDFPARQSLEQIYGCFTAALLRLHQPLRGQQSALTGAMIDVYERNRARFRAEERQQYVYSPRELSRWVRALYEAMSPLESLSLEALVRLWAHEGVRLFHDRLVTDDDRRWCKETVADIAAERFPGVGTTAALSGPDGGPLLYSSWLTKHYLPVDGRALRDFVAARLRVFYEEEMDVPLVVFDDVLEHVLRIDRVLRQPMGHLLLVGESGVGKTVLARFAAWMNGLGVVAVEASPRYTLQHFDEDLRQAMFCSAMRRVGCGGERLCVLVDENDALSAAFMERMNALLASGEVPGLFEGDDRAALLAGCREAAQREGAAVDGEEELLRRFTRDVQRGLHVVFAMNPASADFSTRCMASPALFNRCVVDWLGTWSPRALAQVGLEFTATVDTGDAEGDAGGDADEDREGSGGVAGAGRRGGTPLRWAVVAALVGVHRAAQAAAERQAARGAGRHYMSPRDYLDLIQQFVGLAAEKRSSLEEQQLHMNVGLRKLRETADSVAELGRSLEITGEDLRRKDEAANAKLQQMVAEQNAAERRKAEATALQQELETQDGVMASRRGQAQAELADAEPALLSAQASVRSIKKPMLDEVRGLARPPKTVQTVLEAVATLLGQPNPAWTDVQKVIRRADFIATVVNFDADSLSDKLISDVEAVLAAGGGADLDFESVNRASKACGPLFQWVKSQLAFSRIALRVQPLRDEVARLQAESDRLASEKQGIDSEVDALEASIARYKAEYADSIRDIEAIKAEVATVRQKVARAEALLSSLAQEKGRWEGASTGFRRQMRTLLGDCLLTAAFLTYAGVFDFRTRRALAAECAGILAALGVPARPGLSCADFLSKPADRLRWAELGLPQDDLCVENAVILDRFHRFPLVVDPSGQAARFLLAKYADRRIATTSFADAAFLKKLASAVRFGTPLLIEDVESSVDPALTPVLNRELRRAGGRTLIRLAGEDIDFSPQTLVILATRDPEARFAPDLCSRVTLVNFTVTPASLRSQALGLALRAERPDVELRRAALLRQQGEQSVRLRQLESQLLDTIGAAQGAVLDDDSVVRALEGLKAEAAGLAGEAAKTAEVAAVVAAESALYEPLAGACGALYFAVDALRRLHPLYHFSLAFFLETLVGVLAPGRVPATATTTAAAGTVVSAVTAAVTVRLAGLRDALFADVARRVTRALLQDDRIVFAARLAQIYLHGSGGVPATAAAAPSEDEWELLLQGTAVAVASTAVSGDAAGVGAVGGQELSERQVRDLMAVCRLPAAAALAASVTADAGGAWGAFLVAPDAEARVPMGWLETANGGSRGGVGPARAALLRLLVVRSLRPDRIVPAMELFVVATFGDRFPWNERLDLEAVVGSAAPAATAGPEADSGGDRAAAAVLLCSEAGHDASWRVDALAEQRRRPMASVAMGSSEGYELAERAVAAAARDGSWVLLRNIHLCPDWLEALEKKLHGLQGQRHRDFRLFLTSDIHKALPASLLRQAEILAMEAPPGVRAGVLRFLQAVPAERMAAPPVERCRLYVLAAWLHAVVAERLRYIPLGWSKRHEFSEADAACALTAVDNWLDAAAGTRCDVT
ncbi:unnamed protein product, partial [Phaeothamnion confervicola]